MVDTTQEQDNDTLSIKFGDLLIELSLMYNEFPFYVIEIGADK